MFYLFSDILLQAKPCSPIHPTHGDKFACQQVYPLKECTVDKVFGHTKSQGGLMSVSWNSLQFITDVVYNDYKSVGISEEFYYLNLGHD